MDLLERYLNAVKPLLPRETRDDILRELSDNILSQMEAKADELGRPLDESEKAEVIRKHGHPVVVAARYGRARYLIGPAIFPFYWLILRTAALGALAVKSALVVAFLMIDPAKGQHVASALVSIPFVLVPVFCWITGTFAALEFLQPHLHLDMRPKWDPHSLPEIGKSTAGIVRTTSVAELIFGIVGLVWWQLLSSAPHFSLGPLANLVRVGPFWDEIHWPVFLLLSAYIAQSVVNLIRPDATRARIRLRLLLNATGLAILCLAIRAGEWVSLAPGVHTSEQRDLVRLLNELLLYALWAGLVIGIVQLIWECVKQLRDTPAGCGAHAPATHRPSPEGDSLN